MVDKRLILAVAGSGKTRLIIEKLNTEKRFLILTYTNNNYELIKRRVLNKFGYIPKNINIIKFFDFLYTFCCKPFLYFKYNFKGIYWENASEASRFKKDLSKFMTKNHLLYHNRISQFLEETGTVKDIIEKLELFYDYFIIDEFQDLGGHDFNLIMQISKANINFLFVGDFYQHTYTTSNDGNVNINIYKDYKKYIKLIGDNKILVDLETLKRSYRCSPTICNFVKENLGININSAKTTETKVELIEDKTRIEEIFANDNIIKLVYRGANNLPFYSKNWGDSKGEDDYLDTCIILNKTTTKLFKKNKLLELAPLSKNKLYVALTRTKTDCYIIKEE